VSEENEIIKVLQWPTFGLEYEDKCSQLLELLNNLTRAHRAGCSAYNLILSKVWTGLEAKFLHELPFLPVRIFKLERMISVKDSEIVKTLTSSGTSGQAVSQIYLDRETSALQTRALARIVHDFIGPHRLPMLVIDCPSIISNRSKFSARTAGVLGFSMLGREVQFALNDDMSLNEEVVADFAKRNSGKPTLVFGFTFIVWQHFLKHLELHCKQIDLGGAILIHGGGWKKLESEAVDPIEFNRRIYSSTKINKIHNYYGMVEQTGAIFMECEKGFLHTPAWSEVIVRDPIFFRPLPLGTPGLIQLISVIPHSYPGHSILSEDEGVIIGIDDCGCNRKGSYFKVSGRIKNAEVRGCSDTYSP
jgi:hypothetical protein